MMYQGKEIIKPSLEGLPPELKLQIFRKLLTTPYWVMIDWVPGAFGRLAAYERIPDRAIQLTRIDHKHRISFPTGIFVTRSKSLYGDWCDLVYTENKFELKFPDAAIQWLDQIGPDNVAMLRTLSLTIGSNTLSKFDWMDIITTITEKATNLEHLRIHLEAERGCDVSSLDWLHTGLGNDDKFLHHVCKLVKGDKLKKVTLSGFYARHWPDQIALSTRARLETFRGDTEMLIETRNSLTEFHVAASLLIYERRLDAKLTLTEAQFRDYQEYAENDKNTPEVDEDEIMKEM